MKITKRVQVLIEDPDVGFSDSLYFDTQAEADDDAKISVMAQARRDNYVSERSKPRPAPLPPTVDDVLNIYADAKSKLAFVQDRMKDPTYSSSLKLVGINTEVNAALKAVEDANKSPIVSPK